MQNAAAAAAAKPFKDWRVWGVRGGRWEGCYFEQVIQEDFTEEVTFS